MLTHDLSIERCIFVEQLTCGSITFMYDKGLYFKNL